MDIFGGLLINLLFFWVISNFQVFFFFFFFFGGGGVSFLGLYISVVRISV